MNYIKVILADYFTVSCGGVSSQTYTRSLVVHNQTGEELQLKVEGPAPKFDRSYRIPNVEKFTVLHATVIENPRQSLEMLFNFLTLEGKSLGEFSDKNLIEYTESIYTTADYEVEVSCSNELVCTALELTRLCL